MAPVRMPQHLTEPLHVDSGEARLKFDLMEDLEAGRRSERQVELALAALRDHDEAGGDPQWRGPLLDSAAEAVWRLIVQHEACDVCDHQDLIARYRIPPEVMARLGAF